MFKGGFIGQIWVWVWSPFPYRNHWCSISLFYFSILFFLSLSVLIIRRIINSPFGSVLVGIRENEKRIESVGYNPRYYKIIVFVTSGFFAGLAGTLFCINMKFAALSFAHWRVGAEVVMWL